MMRGLLIGLGIAVGIWLIGIIVLIALGRRSQARELVGARRRSPPVSWTSRPLPPLSPSTGAVTRRRSGRLWEEATVSRRGRIARLSNRSVRTSGRRTGGEDL